ncbi:hypothetical protein QR680_011059 [Steinernema hermaphroditum]|uniref:Activin types I and II receptor domain-containing protein n=1 Tax=Steinernema hermaphroditum TaxID=289476 RepID=A0AA39IR08_9BILA|nr:hypothetical protein QR680_011059 [Steinernema hermaphroditum]
MKTSTLVLLGLVAATLIVDPISSLRCRVYRNNKGIITAEDETECHPGGLCSSILVYRKNIVNYYGSVSHCIYRDRCPPVLNNIERVSGTMEVAAYCCDTDFCNTILLPPGVTTPPPGSRRRIGGVWRRNV